MVILFHRRKQNVLYAKGLDVYYMKSILILILSKLILAITDVAIKC